MVSAVCFLLQTELAIEQDIFDREQQLSTDKLFKYKKRSFYVIQKDQLEKDNNDNQYHTSEEKIIMIK